jgi:hypothetical protein
MQQGTGGGGGAHLNRQGNGGLVSIPLPCFPPPFFLGALTIRYSQFFRSGDGRPRKLGGFGRAVCWDVDFWTDGLMNTSEFVVGTALL